MPETHLLSSGSDILVSNITAGGAPKSSYPSLFSHQQQLRMNGLSGANIQSRSIIHHHSAAVAPHNHHHHHQRRSRLINRRMSSSASMIQEDDSFSAAQCSAQSVFSAMDRFIQSVNNMDSTVLIPSKLKDMDQDELFINASNNHIQPVSPTYSVYSSTSSSSASSTASSISGGHRVNQKSLLMRQNAINNGRYMNYRPSSFNINSNINNNSAPSNSNNNIQLSNSIACPHELYHMLKDVKKELLWGPSVLNGGGCDEASELLMATKPQQQQSLSLSTALATSSSIISSAIQQPTNASRSLSVTSYSASSPMTSGIGTIMSPSSDRDTDSDADSILNSDRDSSSSASEEESTTMLASSFRHHLLGLQTILHQLADTADNLTDRYVDEVEKGGRR